MSVRVLYLLLIPLLCTQLRAQSTPRTQEFCLHGEFDLGTRLQGFESDSGEFYTTSWCVIADDEGRVRFQARGSSNADVEGEFAVGFLPPDTVRLIGLDGGGDLEFNPVDIRSEAARHRFLNPHALLQAIRSVSLDQSLQQAGWQMVELPEQQPVQVSIADDRLQALRTAVDLPLRGRVSVEWRWDWSVQPVRVELRVENDVLFRGEGHWRAIDEEEAAALWQPVGDSEPQVIPGINWPARVAMQLEQLEPDIYVVSGVRSGFNHLVVVTDEGLIVADAPAGWVELYQVPPADLVPGLGISGLSERFIDFLADELPGHPVRAVALTHAHDDHVGGARAFAAAGARLYAPSGAAEMLAAALSADAMPDDRYSAIATQLRIEPVQGRLLIAENPVAVVLHSLDGNPHVRHAIGVQVGNPGYFFQSDLHVPGTDAAQPAADRAASECWFARWAADNLVPDTVVLSSHSRARTPVSMLLGYLDHPRCRQ